MENKTSVVRGPAPKKSANLRQEQDNIQNLLCTLNSMIKIKQLSKYHGALQNACVLIPNLVEKANKKSKSNVPNRQKTPLGKKFTKDVSGNGPIEDSLKEELQRAWNAVDEAYDREERSVKAMSELRMKIADLEAEKGSSENVKEFNIYLAENECLKKKVKQLEEEINSRKESEKKLKKEKLELKKKLSEESREIQNLKTKLAHECKKREEAEREVRKARDATVLRTPKSTESISSQRGSLIKMQKTLGGSRTQLLENKNRETDKFKQRIQELEQNVSENIVLIKRLERKCQESEDSAERSKLREEMSKDEISQLRKHLSMVEEKLEKESSHQKEFDEISKKNASLEKDLKVFESQLKTKTKQLSEYMQSKVLEDEREKQIQKQLQNTKEELEIKCSENEHLKRTTDRLTREIQKYGSLVLQMEGSRDDYMKEVKDLETKVSDLEWKIAELDPENHPKAKKLPVSGTGEPTKKDEVEATKEDARDCMFRAADEEMRKLNEAIVEKDVEIVRLQKIMDQQRILLEDMTAFSAGDHKRNVSGNGSAELTATSPENTTQKRNVFPFTRVTARMCITSKLEELELLKEKVTILEEIIRRGRKPSEVGDNSDYQESQAPDDEYYRSLIESDTKMNMSEKEMELSRQLDNLEQLLQMRTREMTEKDECLKTQFEIIEELKNCVTSPREHDDQLNIMGHKLEKQQKLVEQLKEKAFLYESYIKDYQDEIRTLTQKLKATGTATTSTSGNVLQTTAVSLADQAKMNRNTWRNRK